MKDMLTTSINGVEISFTYCNSPHAFARILDERAVICTYSRSIDPFRWHPHIPLSEVAATIDRRINNAIRNEIGFEFAVMNCLEWPR